MSIRVKRRTERQIDYVSHLYPFAVRAGNKELKAMARRLYCFHWNLTTKEERDEHWRHLPHPSKLPD